VIRALICWYSGEKVGELLAGALAAVPPPPLPDVPDPPEGVPLGCIGLVVAVVIVSDFTTKALDRLVIKP
jgi:hypothetical protein